MIHEQTKLLLCTIIQKPLFTLSMFFIGGFENILINASHYRDKLHGLEYPIGERLIIQVSGMSGGNHIDTSFIDSMFVQHNDYR